MKLLDFLKGIPEDDKFSFNRNKKIMASTTLDTPEEIAQKEVGL